jgi:hypothetical protein
MEDYRKFEILKEGIFAEIQFEELKKGDIFKITDVCDKPIEKGEILWECVEDLKYDENNEPLIKAEVRNKFKLRP